MGSSEQVSIWLRQERSGHGPLPGYDRAQLAVAAIELADADGLAAASMRKVAAAIGAGAASLYRYVEHRNELVELMVDTVLGEVELSPSPSGDWLADLVALAHELRRVYRRHTWLAVDIAAPAMLGPHAVDLLEHGLALLRTLDREPATKLEAMAALVGQVTLAVRTESAGPPGPGRWRASNAAHLAQIISADRHPHLAGALAAAPPSADDPLDRLLPRILTGLLS